MRRNAVTAAAAALVVLGSGAGSSLFAQAAQPTAQQILGELKAAQDVTSARESAAAREVVPLQLQVVIAKFQGDKKTSSLPYMMSFNTTTSPTSRGGSIRMGTQIAIPSTNTVEGKTTTSYNYKDIGTSIDAGATKRADGSFDVYITVSDSAVYTDDQPRGTAGVTSVGGMPVIRSYQTTNRLILKDGQTSQFTAATERGTGEVVKIDVTLKVVK